jgi:hypothetical protein
MAAVLRIAYCVLRIAYSVLLRDKPLTTNQGILLLFDHESKGFCCSLTSNQGMTRIFNHESGDDANL